MKISSLHPVIISENAEKLVEFYSTLGFTTKHLTVNAMGNPTYVIAHGDVELEIMQLPTDAPYPMPAGLHTLRINVDDLDAAVESIKENGGTVVGGPFPTEWTEVIVCQDADGNNLSLMKHIKK